MSFVLCLELGDVLNAFVMICWWKWTDIMSIAVILKHFLFGVWSDSFEWIEWFVRVNHFKLSDSSVAWKPLKVIFLHYNILLKMLCTVGKYCCLYMCCWCVYKWKWFSIIFLCVRLVRNWCKHALFDLDF